MTEFQKKVTEDLRRYFAEHRGVVPAIDWMASLATIAPSPDLSEESFFDPNEGKLFTYDPVPGYRARKPLRKSIGPPKQAGHCS